MALGGLAIDNAALYPRRQRGQAARGRYVACVASVQGSAIRLTARHKSRLNSFVTDDIAGNE
jgi:hypothetical protein